MHASIRAARRIAVPPQRASLRVRTDFPQRDVNEPAGASPQDHHRGSDVRCPGIFGELTDGSPPRGSGEVSCESDTGALEPRGQLLELLLATRAIPLSGVEGRGDRSDLLDIPSDRHVSTGKCRTTRRTPGSGSSIRRQPGPCARRVTRFCQAKSQMTKIPEREQPRMESRTAPGPLLEPTSLAGGGASGCRYNPLPVNGFSVARRVDPGQVPPAWPRGGIPDPGHPECHRRSLIGRSPETNRSRRHGGETGPRL